jgi:hypothetical protein
LVFTGEVCKHGLSSSASSRERKERIEKINPTPIRILWFCSPSRRSEIASPFSHMRIYTASSRLEISVEWLAVIGHQMLM